MFSEVLCERPWLSEPFQTFCSSVCFSLYKLFQLCRLVLLIHHCASPRFFEVLLFTIMSHPHFLHNLWAFFFILLLSFWRFFWVELRRPCKFNLPYLTDNPFNYIRPCLSSTGCVRGSSCSRLLPLTRCWATRLPCSANKNAGCPVKFEL